MVFDCLYARKYISGTANPINFYAPYTTAVALSSGLASLRMLCTSGFADDAIIARDGHRKARGYRRSE